MSFGPKMVMSHSSKQVCEQIRETLQRSRVFLMDSWCTSSQAKHPAYISLHANTVSLLLWGSRTTLKCCWMSWFPGYTWYRKSMTSLIERVYKFPACCDHAIRLSRILCCVWCASSISQTSGDAPFQEVSAKQDHGSHHCTMRALAQWGVNRLIL